MELVEIFRPVMKISAFFAMATFRIIRNNNLEIILPKKRTFFTYCHIIIILFGVIFSVIYRQKLKSMYNNPGVVVATVEFVHFNCRIFTTLVCLIFGNFGTKRLVDFLKSISELDLEFKRIGVEVDYSSVRRSSRILMTVVIFKLFIQQIPMLIHISFNRHWETYRILDYFVAYIPLVLLQILLAHWIIYLDIIKIHFSRLNEYLAIFKYRECWVVSDYVKNISILNQRKINLSQWEILRTSGSIYDQLCKHCTEINCVFAWQILIVIPSLFILIIYNSFHLCEMIKGRVDFELAILIFDFLYFVSFVELVLPCVLVREEAEEFANILHKIDVNAQRDPQIESELNLLILQIYHEKVNFSAYEIFPLDGTLMYSIFGAVSTYLVILLQFDL